MAVPNTTTFSLQDVVTEVGPTTNDLVDCFADANLAYFDPNYYGTGNDLLEFRNYCSSTSTCATQIFAHYWSNVSQPQNACIQTVSQGRYVNTGATLNTALVLYQDSPTKSWASSGWYEGSGGNLRYWGGTSFTSSATCSSWSNILPSSGNATLYTACGQSLGATKRYYTGGLGTNTQLWSDAGYTNYTTTTNFYYRYATAGNTNGTGSYFRVSNTTGLVSSVGACPASTTTTTTTAAPSLTQMWLSEFEYNSRTDACDFGPSDFLGDSLWLSGGNNVPAVGEYVYTTSGGTTPWTTAEYFWMVNNSGGTGSGYGIRIYLTGTPGQIREVSVC